MSNKPRHTTHHHRVARHIKYTSTPLPYDLTSYPAIIRPGHTTKPRNGHQR